MKRIFLDTNVFDKVDEGDGQVLAYLEETSEICTSVIVAGELFYGFKGGNKEKQNIRKLDEFLSENEVEVALVSTETAKIYGQIAHHLKKMGKPVPTNDMWIAAQAMELGAELVTFDRKHFKEIPGLRLWERD